jgi:peroxiredoxin
MEGRELQQIQDALETAVTQRGENLAALSQAAPVMLVFLRHAGCTFCREALADIARSRSAIEATGARIVLVHMGDSEAVGKLLVKYGLRGIDCIRDADRKLYRALGLKRGTLWQMFGPKVMWRAVQACILSRHGVGKISADSFQMPGLFVLEKARVVHRLRHGSAGDRPDYAAVCAAAAQARIR